MQLTSILCFPIKVYDRLFRQQSCASRPMLLPRLNSPNSPVKLISTASNEPSLPPEAPSTAQMVEPPVCDIFLCDYCGADFDTLSAIKVFQSFSSFINSIDTRFFSDS